MGYYVVCILVKIVEKDMRRAGLTTIWDNRDGTPNHERLHFGIDVDLAAGLFEVPIARWEALPDDAAAIINFKKTRVQPRKLACLVGIAIYMKLVWGPITRFYSRNIYHILGNVPSLNCCVTTDGEDCNELLFGKDLLRLRLESDICRPCTKGLSIQVATDANDFGWGRHTLGGNFHTAHDTFSE